MLYAGVDAHKKYSQVVLTDDHGTRLAQASLSNDPGCFQEFFKQAAEPVKAVVEAGRTWGVIYDLLESIGVEPILANPLKPRAIIPMSPPSFKGRWDFFRRLFLYVCDIT